MYAVNASDLRKFKNDRVHPVNMLLIPMLTDKSVTCEPGQNDGDALLVSETAGEQWHALLHVIRKGSGRYRGIQKSHLRVYRKNGGNWERM
jgi:hypothetical protein